MARRLYTLLFYLLTPFILLRLLFRAIAAPAYRARIGERFGFFKAPFEPGGIWVHAVSVGETIAALPLIEALQAKYPNHPITVTTMTPTGSERVRSALGGSVFHVYAPYDLPGAIQRFLIRVKPTALIIMETELWPNIIDQCHRQNIAVVLANGRLSEKSAKGYRRFNHLTKPMLQQLSLVAAQHQADATRFASLGVEGSSLQITGSIKFDVAIDHALQREVEVLKARWSNQGERIIVIAASTHPGEDEVLLETYQRLQQEVPTLLLIIVPRHPERFDAVAKLCEPFTVARRSLHEEPDATTHIYLADTMGEMLLLLGTANIAFVGGSLINHGGHNMLEPAAWKLPIITGISDFNFAAISQWLQEAGGLQTVANQDALHDALLALCLDREACQQQGQKAYGVVENNRGALGRLLDAIAPFIRSA